MLASSVYGKGLRQGSGKALGPNEYSLNVFSKALIRWMACKVFFGIDDWMDCPIDERPPIVLMLHFVAKRWPTEDITPTRTLFPSLSRTVAGPKGTRKYYFAGIGLKKS